MTDKTCIGWGAGEGGLRETNGMNRVKTNTVVFADVLITMF